MNKGGCERCQGLVDGYLAGTLDGPDAEFVRAHVSQCAACREDLEFARKLMDTVKAVHGAGRGGHCDPGLLVDLAVNPESVRGKSRQAALEHLRRCDRCSADFERALGVADDLGILAGSRGGVDAEEAATPWSWLMAVHRRLACVPPRVWIGAAACAVVIVAAAIWGPAQFPGSGRDAPHTVLAGSPDGTLRHREGAALGVGGTAAGPRADVAGEGGSEDAERGLSADAEAVIEAGAETDAETVIEAGAETATEVAGGEPVKAEPPEGDPVGAGDAARPSQEAAPREASPQAAAAPTLVRGDYLMSEQGPVPRAFVLEGAWARTPGDAPAAYKMSGEIVLQAPEEAAILVIPRPPGLVAAQSAEMQLVRADQQSPGLRWRLTLPAGDGPIEVKIPSTVLYEGEYRITFLPVPAAAGAAAQPGVLHLSVHCAGK